MLELLWLLLTALVAWIRPRHDLVLENLLLRHQLSVLTRKTRTRPRARLRAWDKLLWVLARRFCASWREHLRIVTPDTVVRWHRQGWRLFWRWKSRSRVGRPHLSPEDLFTVSTLTFKTLYVLVLIAHGRRELVHVNMSANPTSAWVWRQVIEATPWGRKPRHLLRDRDAVHGRDFRQRARRIGIDAIATPLRSPRANAIASLKPSAASASTTWSCSTSSTWRRCWPSSSATTTKTGRIAHSACRHPS